MKIGEFDIQNPVWLAPMAGITDRPFRTLCRKLGAGHAVSEMISSNLKLQNTAKTQGRMDHRGEAGPIHIQIAGSDPEEMAGVARLAVDRGADIVDINMGCPAKKVCSKLAGSSLLRDEVLVERILNRVVESVDVPVTLKTRTGWCRDTRNIHRVGRIAERAGIRCIALHGRTRSDLFKGEAEFDSLLRLRDAVSLPLIANGDIRDQESAERILVQTGADAIMIGREMQSRPWLAGQIAAFLTKGRMPADPDVVEKHRILMVLVRGIHQFYGPDLGPRMARKHIVAQIPVFSPTAELRRRILKTPDPVHQIELLNLLCPPPALRDAA